MVAVLGALARGISGGEGADGTDHAFIDGLLEGETLRHIFGIHLDRGSLLCRGNAIPLPEQRRRQRFGGIRHIGELALPIGGDAYLAGLIGLEADA